MAESTVGVFEMLWDCPFCGTAALLGKTNRYCPSCGAPQDETKRYFPPPGKEKEVVANTEFDGVDVKCPACGTPNGAKANNCKHCGSPLTEAAKVKKLADRENGPPKPPAAAPKPAAPSGGGWIKKLVILGVLVVVALIVVAMSWKKQVTATVAGHSWKREIAIESLQQVSESAWRESVPSDAYSTSCSKEQRSTKKVPDGETCHTKDVDRGNGTFERKNVCEPKFREEPVLDDKCRYSVDRWRRSRALTTAGGLAEPPQWPTVSLRQSGNCRGCEREGAHSEEYLITLHGAKGEQYSCGKPEPVWRNFKAGQAYPLQVRMLTGGADCDSLQP